MFLSFVVSPSLWYFGIIVNLSWCVPLSQLHTSLPHCSWVILPTDTWVAECLTAHNSFGSYFIILIYIHFTWLFISKTVLSKTDYKTVGLSGWLTLDIKLTALGQEALMRQKKSSPHFGAHQRKPDKNNSRWPFLSWETIHCLQFKTRPFCTFKIQSKRYIKDIPPPTY